MALERELKYIATEGFEELATHSIEMEQGYLCSKQDGISATVRVRIADQKGFLTIKGMPMQHDIASRLEYEYEIPLEDARSMMQMAMYPPVKKTRYFVPWQGYTFEVDRYYGANQGLLTAEVELEPDQAPPTQLPSWVVKEVTGRGRYYNSALSRNPFQNWSDKRREEYDEAMAGLDDEA